MQFSLQQRLYSKFHYLFRAGRRAFIAPAQGPYVELAPEETAAMVREIERREERIARLRQAYAEMDMTPKRKGSVPGLIEVREVLPI
jgi:hypothetical protein